MRKILYISGTRADYGLMRHTLYAIRNHPKLAIEVAATGMHLMPDFGHTIEEIKKDAFKIHEIEATYQKDTRESMARFLGTCVLQLTEGIKNVKPDIILILGDRAEMLAGAIAGAYTGVAVAHVHGGDITSTVDESARHAITKLSHIHFAATKMSAKRIVKMGEDPRRVFVVGAPGLDSMTQEKLFTPREIAHKYHVETTKPMVIVIQHPVTQELDRAAKEMKETMEAIKELGIQAIVIYPNADAGGRSMIAVIEQYQNSPFIYLYKNIPHREYVSLMRIADAIVGNSSGGIIEAPAFNLPFVNVGTRQRGRERTANVIDVGYEKEQIKNAIKKALFDKQFIKKVKLVKNPYGEGNAGRKIATILSQIPLNARLIQKHLTY